MFIGIIIFILGLLLGSFANVCIWRIPRNEEIVIKPSHCPKCNSPIDWYDNIPIISYIVLNRKCRYCKSQISFRYPVIELINGLLFLGVYLKYGADIRLAGSLPFVWAMVVISAIDIEHYIIPDIFSIGGLFYGLLFSILAAVKILPALPVFPMGQLAWWPVLDNILGAMLGGGFLFLAAWIGEKIFKQEAMGGGDIKLAAMVGAFWGWKAVLESFFAAFLIGSVIGIAMLSIGKIRKSEAPEGVKPRAMIPFGPFLAVGALISLFWGRELLDLYLGLCGL
jgi:leader peptidase (prepilin peptidase)/N-methyltransferase